MKRQLLTDLNRWKNSPDRKPLILKGVRQSGKTYLLKEFGRKGYSDVAYFNFEGNESLMKCFDRDLDPARIVTELGIFRNRSIVPGETLIIFDEIQFCNRALTSLKYFCENASGYHVASAGSLLGIALSKPLSFPVGKVDFLTLRPMSFYEFVLAHGDDQMLVHLEGLDAKEKIPEILTDKMVEFLRTYYVVGGMPEAVSKWVETKDIEIVERIQQRILDSYELDFAKYAPAVDVPKLNLIWRSIPDQLARENAKFMFSHAKPGARAKDLEDALEWLIAAGMVHKVPKIEKPFMPLSAYADPGCFKLYAADVGLLRKMAGLPAAVIFQAPETYREFKGALAENFTLTEMVNASFETMFYWKSGNTAEVDFIVQAGQRIVPLEVKSGRGKRSRSLAEYRKKFSPEIAVRCSMENLEAGSVMNVPLYMLWRMGDYLDI